MFYQTLRPLVVAALSGTLAPFASAALIHHWQLDEGGATTTTDSAGSNDGSLTSGAFFEPTGGAVGGAVSLSGNGEHINAGTDVVPLGGSFTISLWAKRSGIYAESYLIGQGDNGDVNQSLHIGFREGNGFTFAFYANDLEYSNLAVNTDTSDFHHWVMTYDTTTNARNIYLDGATTAVASDIASSDFLGSGSNTFWIGKRWLGESFNGLIDDVRVYDTALTGNEANALFTGNNLSAVPEPGALFSLGALVGGGLLLRRRSGDSL